MQANAPVIHGQKRHGHHQRNGDAHDQARSRIQRPAPPQGLAAGALVQAKADEAHRQHDRHGLHQHLDKLVDRGRHRLGLVLNLPQCDTDGQRLADLLGGVGQCFTEGDDVAALGHGHAQCNHLLPLKTHLDGGWVDVIPLDLGDVTQAQLTATRADWHGAQFVDRLELASHPHLHHVQRRLHGTGRFHGVLLPQLGQHGIQVQPQLRQAFLGNFDVEFFVLHAKQLDLGHIGHTQQLLAHIIGKGFHLGVAETGRLQRIDDAIHITKVIVEKRPLHTLRQGAAHVTNPFSHLVPDVGHLAAPGRILDLEDDL